MLINFNNTNFFYVKNLNINAKKILPIHIKCLDYYLLKDKHFVKQIFCRFIYYLTD